MATFKQEYFLSQSISGSFYADDIVNVTFQARRKGNPVEGLSYVQYCDIWGFTDSSSFNVDGFEDADPPGQRLTHKQFSLPIISYAEKSFIAGLDNDYQVLTILVSGSVLQDDTAPTSNEPSTELNIDYDAFSLKVEQP